MIMSETETETEDEAKAKPLGAEWAERVRTETSAKQQSADVLAELVFALGQLNEAQELHCRCQALERFDRTELLPLGGPPLPLARFPLPLMPRTIDKIREGVWRSLSAFLHGLHGLALFVHPHFLHKVTFESSERAVRRQQQMVEVLRDEFERVIANEHVRIPRVVKKLQAISETSINDEQHELLRLRACCVAVREALTKFSKLKLAGTSRSVAKCVRGWVHATATRGGAASLAKLTEHHVLSRIFVGKGDVHLHLAEAFDVDAHGEVSSDVDALALQAALRPHHVAVIKALTEQVEALDFLSSCCADNPRWNGLEVCTTDHWVPTDPLPAPNLNMGMLRPPSHLGAFVNGPLAAKAPDEFKEPQADIDPMPLAHYHLPEVRVAAMLVAALEGGHMQLELVSRDFLRRIATSEFVHYEHCTSRVVEETLVPFGRRVGIPYCA